MCLSLTLSAKSLLLKGQNRKINRNEPNPVVNKRLLAGWSQTVKHGAFCGVSAEGGFVHVAVGWQGKEVALWWEVMLVAVAALLGWKQPVLKAQLS